MSQQKQRFVELLEELFQLNQPELDFGLYRILHARSQEIRAFMSGELATEIDQAFAGQAVQSAHELLQAAKQKVLDDLADDAFDAAGELKPEYRNTKIGKDYLQAQQAAREGGGPLSDQAQVYDHLYRFFSRYYDKGDFMSKRYFVAENDQRSAPYAVPYDGREVMLHWANKDQYYIKSSEHLSNYSFDLTEALRMEAQRQGKGQELDFGGDASLGPMKVHFRLAAATEGEHNNVKESQDRFFLIHADEPIKFEAGSQGHVELVVQFEYRPDPDKTGQANTWQQQKLAEAAQTVLQALQTAEPSEAKAQAYARGLASLSPTEKRPDRTVLTKYMAQFADRNTMDYFIHKDLGGFLRRELDFYIKNEVMRLDDIESAQAPRVEAFLGKLRVLRRIARRVIDFLSQIENFLKKVWEKQKFVVSAEYLITLDNLSEHHIEWIASNRDQWENWLQLGFIDAIPETQHDRLIILSQSKNLPIDTKVYSDDQKHALIAAIDDIDRKTTATLIKSDNYSALRLLQFKNRASFSTIYIDPPYNTGDDGFPYKDRYRHSSWMSMIENRLSAAKPLLNNGGLLCTSIDRDENRNYLPLLFQIFGEENYVEETVWQKAYGGGSKTKHFNNLHEYVHVFAHDKRHTPYLTLPPDPESVKYYKLKDSKFSVRGKYRLQPLNTNSNDFRKNLTFPIPTPKFETYGTKGWVDGLLQISNLLKSEDLQLKGDWDSGWHYEDSSGNIWGGDLVPPPRQWQWSWEKCKAALIELELVIERNGDSWVVSYKQYRFDENGRERPRKPSSINIGPYTQTGTDELRSLFGEDVSKYPKPTGLIKEFIAIGYENRCAEILDFFAGSGTTGHAVIDLNRDDDGSRRFTLVEMSDLFEKAVKPRVLKAAFARSWSTGKPTSKDSTSLIAKYLTLESYEDSLNNLVLGPHINSPASSEFLKDYILKYWLSFETANSPSLLNVQQFTDPTAYALTIKQPGTDAQVQRTVDLVETFNWLIGLHVTLLDKPRQYAIDLCQEADPELPGDQGTRWVHTGIDEVDTGEFWFRMVEGHVFAVPGDELSRERVLVIWRKLTGVPGRDQAALEAWLSKMKINPRDTDFATIYVNGSHALNTDGSAGTRVCMIEETFAQRMWEDA